MLIEGKTYRLKNLSIDETGIDDDDIPEDRLVVIDDARGGGYFKSDRNRNDWAFDEEWLEEIAPQKTKQPKKNMRLIRR